MVLKILILSIFVIRWQNDVEKRGFDLQGTGISFYETIAGKLRIAKRNILNYIWVVL